MCRGLGELGAWRPDDSSGSEYYLVKPSGSEYYVIKPQVVVNITT